MTREELIEHWALIASTVFAAEHNIINAWKPKLKEVEYSSSDEVFKVKEEYLRAIAEEIVSKTSEEELSNLYY